MSSHSKNHHNTPFVDIDDEILLDDDLDLDEVFIDDEDDEDDASANKTKKHLGVRNVKGGTSNLLQVLASSGIDLDEADEDSDGETPLTRAMRV